MWFKQYIAPFNGHSNMFIAFFSSILYSDWISHTLPIFTQILTVLLDVYQKVSLKFNHQFFGHFSTFEPHIQSQSWTSYTATLDVNFENFKMFFSKVSHLTYTVQCHVISCLQSTFNERITGLIELVIELIVFTCLKLLYTLPFAMHFFFHFHQTLGYSKYSKS